MKTRSSRTAAFLFLSSILFVLVSCATAQPVAFHSFEFDARSDSPDMAVLDFRYGRSNAAGTYAPERQVSAGKTAQAWGVGGSIPVGDFLYVKWRSRKTGEVYEETVDLRDRLPPDMTDHRLYFVVREATLYVYLITPERIPQGNSPGPIWTYRGFKTITLHPRQ